MATQNYRNKAKGEPIEVRIVLSIARSLFWLVRLPFGATKKPKNFPRQGGVVDVNEVAKRWADIQMTIGLGGVTHFGSAVIAADKLLDHVLKQKGYIGETMGDRLKSAQDDLSMTIYQEAWSAHKLRNQLVHEVDSQVMDYQAKEAIRQYEHVLRGLGALR